MVIPLLANQDLTPMLTEPRTIWSTAVTKNKNVTEKFFAGQPLAPPQKKFSEVTYLIVPKMISCNSVFFNLSGRAEPLLTLL